MGMRRVIRVTALALGAGTVAMSTGAVPSRAMSPSESAMPAARADSQVLPVEARAVRYRNSYRMRESFAGKTVARRASDLGFESGGPLAAVLVNEGDGVRAGQPLARLDRRQLEARRDELAARLELARLTAGRRKNLLKRNNASRQSYDEARLEEAATAAALEAVEVQLDLAVLKSPYEAVVVERLADEGTIARPGQPILRIIEKDAWEARIGLPPQTAARLSPGDKVTLRVSGVEYGAVLRTVLPRIDQNTRTALALFDIEDPQGRLRSGALARVEIETEVRERGFWLPVTALTEGRRGLWTAYVIGAPAAGHAKGTGVAERRQLQIIHVETDRAYVRGAVKEGEYVITAGVHRIVPGQMVRRAGALSAGRQ